MNTRIAVLVVLCASVAFAEEKPRVYVQGKGSENVSTNGSAGGGRHWGTWGAKSTVDAHDESMEVTKDLQKECPGVIMTLNQANADYTLMLNRESKQNRGLLRTNSQVQVASRSGDIIGTNATRTVGNAAKDACQLITSDWSSHGHPSSVADAAPEMKTQGSQPNTQVQPVVNATGTVQPEAVVGSNTAPAASGDDAARKEKQRQACLDLAKENPAITCK